jgi:hypothetical protein
MEGVGMKYKEMIKNQNLNDWQFEDEDFDSEKEEE